MNLPTVCSVTCRLAHTLLLPLNGVNALRWDPQCQMIRSSSEMNILQQKKYWVELAVDIVYWLQKLDHKIS